MYFNIDIRYKMKYWWSTQPRPQSVKPNHDFFSKWFSIKREHVFILRYQWSKYEIIIVHWSNKPRGTHTSTRIMYTCTVYKDAETHPHTDTNTHERYTSVMVLPARWKFTPFPSNVDMFCYTKSQSVPAVWITVTSQVLPGCPLSTLLVLTSWGGPIRTSSNTSFITEPNKPQLDSSPPL